MAQMSVHDAIKNHVRDGITIALEGFTHLIPFAMAHEIIRQRYRDLHLIRMTPDLIYDQMIGMGLVRQLSFSWGGNPGVGSLHRLRDAVEHQWPHGLILNEYSHAAMACAYSAGAAHLPFGLMRGFSLGELALKNKAIGEIVCPYTQQTLMTVAAINPDLTILHAQQVDREGNVFLYGITGAAREAAMAAKKIIVSVEEQVDKLATNQHGFVLPHWIVSAYCLVPGGAYPSYAQAYYLRDNAFYQYWDTISRDRDVFLQWMHEHVMNCENHQEFLQKLKCVA